MIEVAKEQEFKFGLSQLVELNVSEEFGEVAARAQYANGENQYWIHYKAADGCAKTEWFAESQLNMVEDDNHPGCPVYGARELPPGAEVEPFFKLNQTVRIKKTGEIGTITSITKTSSEITYQVRVPGNLSTISGLLETDLFPEEMVITGIDVTTSGCNVHTAHINITGNVNVLNRTEEHAQLKAEAELNIRESQVDKLRGATRCECCGNCFSQKDSTL